MEQRNAKGQVGSLPIARLIVTLTALGLFALNACYKNFTPDISAILVLSGNAFWAILLAEQFLRFIKMSASEKHEYFKFRKMEIIFFALSLVCLPIGFMPGFAMLRLVLLLKLPAALANFNDEKVFQSIINIFIVALIVIFLFPFFNVFAVSFSSPGQVINLLPKAFNTYAMEYVLQDKAFFRAMGISVLVTAVGTIISVISMSMAAYPLSKKNLPFRKGIMMFFVVVMLFTGGMAPNMLLMNTLKLTNTIWALIFPSVVQVFYLILLKGFFEDVPVELEESARLDGASNYTILFRVIFPIAAPMIATVAFFTVIHYWNNINNSILYITSNQSVYPLPMYIRNFLSRNPMDIAMTNPGLMQYWDNVKMSYILLSIVPVLILYPFSFSYLKNGVTMGAVKG